MVLSIKYKGNAMKLKLMFAAILSLYTSAAYCGYWTCIAKNPYIDYQTYATGRTQDECADRALARCYRETRSTNCMITDAYPDSD